MKLNIITNYGGFLIEMTRQSGDCNWWCKWDWRIYCARNAQTRCESRHRNFYDAGGKKLADELGENVSFIHVDVSNEEQVEAMVKHSVDTFGKVDILFSNAGIGLTSSTH